MVLGSAPRKGLEVAHEREGTWYIKTIIIITIIKTMHVKIFKNLKRKAHTVHPFLYSLQSSNMGV